MSGVTKPTRKERVMTSIRKEKVKKFPNIPNDKGEPCPWCGVKTASFWKQIKRFHTDQHYCNKCYTAYCLPWINSVTHEWDLRKTAEEWEEWKIRATAEDCKGFLQSMDKSKSPEERRAFIINCFKTLP